MPEGRITKGNRLNIIESQKQLLCKSVCIFMCALDGDADGDNDAGFDDNLHFQAGKGKRVSDRTGSAQ